MIDFQTFLIGLLVTSTLTGLVTEAIKTILVERNIKYYANSLAGLVSAVLSTFVGISYIVIANIGFTSQIIVCLIAQIFMNWLCAMIGYDKVIQAMEQFKINKK